METSELEEIAKNLMPENFHEICETLKATFGEFILIGTVKADGTAFTRAEIRTANLATYIAVMFRKSPELYFQTMARMQSGAPMHSADVSHISPVLDDAVVFTKEDF